ncbi:MAG: hypothetical protein CMC52_03055 [Flavobacteriaceae bacterium]|nr:hypothetical protein [Flavobacteriaceae bacterium]|tara:strand:+ start:5439 stop:5747 length:309 start_codon:yes stop_codon:yes gene_type:complete
MRNKPKKLTEDLFNEMEKVCERYSNREDFDSGAFAYSLARYTMYMLFETAASPLAATGMLARAMQNHMIDLRHEEKLKEDNLVGELVDENGICIPVDKSQKH